MYFQLFSLLVEVVFCCVAMFGAMKVVVVLFCSTARVQC